MLNNVIICGRLVKDPKLEDNKSIITLAVNRAYKSEEGVYETDFIDIILENSVARNTCEYCRKGDLIGIKGRLENRYEEDKKINYVIADRVTFLATNKTETKESE